MTYAQAQDEFEKGRDVVLTVKMPDNTVSSTTLKAADYKLPCEFMVTCNNLIRGLSKDEFVFSSP